MSDTNPYQPPAASPMPWQRLVRRLVAIAVGVMCTIGLFYLALVLLTPIWRELVHTSAFRFRGVPEIFIAGLPGAFLAGRLGRQQRFTTGVLVGVVLLTVLAMLTVVEGASPAELWAVAMRSLPNSLALCAGCVIGALAAEKTGSPVTHRSTDGQAPHQS